MDDTASPLNGQATYPTDRALTIGHDLRQRRTLLRESILPVVKGVSRSTMKTLLMLINCHDGGNGCNANFETLADEANIDDVRTVAKTMSALIKCGLVTVRRVRRTYYRSVAWDAIAMLPRIRKRDTEAQSYPSSDVGHQGVGSDGYPSLNAGQQITTSAELPPISCAVTPHSLQSCPSANEGLNDLNKTNVNNSDSLSSESSANAQVEVSQTDDTLPDGTLFDVGANRDLTIEALDDSFSEWYLNYPKKVARKRAEVAYRRAVNEIAKEKGTSKREAVALLLQWTLERVKSISALERKFRKDPATWLNAGCYLDELLCTRSSTVEDMDEECAASHANVLRRMKSLGIRSS